MIEFILGLLTGLIFGYFSIRFIVKKELKDRKLI